MIYDKNIKTNDIKKGWVVLCRDGRIHKVMDNKKGIIRMVETTLFFDDSHTEIGSTYVNIWGATEDLEGNCYNVELTPAQIKKFRAIRSCGL